MAPTLTSEGWAQIRFDYEHSERPIAEICAEHGISSGTLRDRMRRWGWRRRRPPIPREGPPPLPLPAPVVEPAASAATPLPTTGDAHPPLEGEGRTPERSDGGRGGVNLPDPSPHHAAHCARGDPPPPEPAPGRAQARPGWKVQDGEAGALTLAAGAGATCASPARPVAASESAAPEEIDDGALVARLQGAVARLLPAIEAIVTKLAAGTTPPREMEHAGRALGALTRTLRELNALLGERRTPADAPARGPADDRDDAPEDLEAFRIELTRRMNAVVAAR